MNNLLTWLLTVITIPIRALLSLPARMLSGSRRLAGTSLPFQVALLMFIVLLISVPVIVFLYWRMNRLGNADFLGAKLDGVFWVTTTVLVFLIPFVLYKALSLWLEGPASPFGDIDQAWNAGLRELQRKGLDLRQIPLFLVVGSTSEQQEQSIFQAAGVDFLVTGAPQGNASLHWYARPEAVYVVASRASCLSGLARNIADAPSPAADDRPVAPGGTQGVHDLRQTIPVGGMSRPVRPDPAETVAPVRPQDESPPAIQKFDDLRGTIVPSTVTHLRPQAGRSPVGRSIQRDKNFFQKERKRFAWLCRLIRRSRLPYAPINGVLALLPFSYVQSSESGVRNLLSDNLRDDLEEVLASLMIRCPVTVLVTDLDEDPGFLEFVGRMVGRGGLESVKERRFGSSFPLEIPVTPDRAQRLAAILGAAFEGFVYDFFHDEESVLRATKNTSLYAFLSKIRRSVKNLGTIFGSFCSLYPQGSHAAQASPEVIFFAGCYFAGTGRTNDRQVFVKRVLERPIDEQEKLEWTTPALREDSRYQWLGLMISAVDTVLLLGFVVVGVLWWRK